jgi:hypothetical protein
MVAGRYLWVFESGDITRFTYKPENYREAGVVNVWDLNERIKVPKDYLAVFREVLDSGAKRDLVADMIDQNKFWKFVCAKDICTLIR